MTATVWFGMETSVNTGNPVWYRNDTFPPTRLALILWPSAAVQRIFILGFESNVPFDLLTGR